MFNEIIYPVIIWYTKCYNNSQFAVSILFLFNVQIIKGFTFDVIWLIVYLERNLAVRHGFIFQHQRLKVQELLLIIQLYSIWKNSAMSSLDHALSNFQT